jgi:hypothetical protein
MYLDTDQVKCYDSSGREISCRHSGQDAAGPKTPGVNVAGPDRFRIHKDAVEDRLTGLIWARQANPAGFPLTWMEALDFVAQHSETLNPVADDWRLPTRRELFTLLSHQQVNPALPAGHPFEGVFNGYYWTQTACARLPDQVWYVHLGGGKVYRGMQHGAYMVWPVAGQLTDPVGGPGRITIQGDTFIERTTGRRWFAAGDLSGLARNWEEALDAVRELNRQRVSGHRDWRLPTIRELESLVDDRRHSPALAPEISIGASGMAGFWSATTSVYEPRYAWVLYPLDGALGVGYKPLADFHTLAVRG